MVKALNVGSDVEHFSSTVDCNSTSFNHEGLCQVHNVSFVPETFVVGTLYVLLQSVYTYVCFLLNS